jgi:hypothetical protein
VYLHPKHGSHTTWVIAENLLLIAAYQTVQEA